MIRLTNRFVIVVVCLSSLMMPPLAPAAGEANLKPLDLSAQASRAMKGFLMQVPRRLPGPEGFYRPAFGCSLLPGASIAGGHGMMARWECGDLTARAILAWITLREMTGDVKTGQDVEDGQRRFLLSILHPDTGLVFVPELVNKDKGTYRYHSWDQSRALRALVRLYETEPGDRGRLQPLIERMIRGLDAFSDIRGTDQTWGPYACWSADEFDHDHKPVPHPFDRNAYPNVGELIPDPAGSCIEALAQYAELTDDPKAVDLAVRFTNGEFGQHRSDKFPPDQKRFAGFAPDGTFAGHFHSKSTTLLGIVELSHYLATHGRRDEAVRYLRQVRKTYDWIFAADNKSRGSRIGWFPERPRVGGAEICGTADMLEIAGAMAGCATLDVGLHDWADLYDDAESMTVNMIARGQIRLTPEFEKCLVARYGADAPRQLETARRLDGTWPTCPPPNDLFGGNALPLSGCCQYAGVRALHSGWRDALTYADGAMRINYFLNRRSPHAVMTTRMPAAGEAEIAVRQEADVFVHVPSWLKPEQLTLTVDGSDVDAATRLDETQHYVRLGRLAAGAKISIRFPLEARTTRETIAGVAYTIKWRGNYVVGISPPGTNFPLFP